MIMKKALYNIFSLLSVAAVLFAGVSCEVEDPQDEGTVDTIPSFPELVVEDDIEPGTVMTLKIKPNMAWTVYVPEGDKNFKILDGNFSVYTLKGNASSEEVEVKIWTNNAESFVVRSCEVKMTMGGETKVIAKFSLHTEGRSLETYRANLTDEGRFEVVEGGGSYVYETEPMTEEDVIELVWDQYERRFCYPVRVSSNFDWNVEWPEWARADISLDSKKGDLHFEIYGVSSMLPLEDSAEGIIRFSGPEIEKTYKITIPPCIDKFSYTLGGNASLNYDHAGYLHSEMGSLSNEPVYGQIFGPEKSRIVVFELTDNGYVEAETSWVNVSVSPWDALDGAPVLQLRDVEISAERYTGKTDRKAMIVFLPATAPEDATAILAAGGMSLKEEYESNMVPVVQTGCPDDYITFEYDASTLRRAGIVFERSAEILLPELNLSFAEGASAWQYNLSYTKELSGARASFYLMKDYETITVYDTEGNEIKDVTSNWLSFTEFSDLYGQINMDMSKFVKDVPSAIDGYVVFKDEKGKVLAVVHSFYVEEVKSETDVLVDVADEIFVDPEAAKAAGATIYEILAGPTYELHKDTFAPLYVLKYTKDQTELELKTYDNLFLYMCMGKGNGPEMVAVDGTTFYDTAGYMLEWDDVKNHYITPYKGTTTIKMTMPESYTEKVMTEVIQFNSSTNSEDRVMNLICILELL